jgi:hypothetical protein
LCDGDHALWRIGRRHNLNGMRPWLVGRLCAEVERWSKDDQRIEGMLWVGAMTETWELVRTDRSPVAGEIRYVRKLIPNPAEPWSQMFPIFRPVVWNGTEWIEIDEWSALHMAALRKKMWGDAQ